VVDRAVRLPRRILKANSKIRGEHIEAAAEAIEHLTDPGRRFADQVVTDRLGAMAHSAAFPKILVDNLPARQKVAFTKFLELGKDRREDERSFPRPRTIGTAKDLD
jgi:hypothetical protein